ncbi:MAG: glycosyltransferase, partial [Candidatus Zixiibacteriota bacterium]
MSDPIKALILTHNYPRHKGDFSGVFLQLLAQRLPEHGVLPIILAPHDEGIADKETFGQVEIHRFRYEDDETKETLAYRGDMDRRGRSGPLKLHRFLKKFEEKAAQIIEHGDVDILAGQWLIPAGIVMRRLSRRSNLPELPMILSSHGTDLRLANKFSPFSRWYLGSW